MTEAATNARVADLLSSTGLVEALENDRFKQFLDHVPVAIAVAEVPTDLIAYANIEFERLVGRPVASIEGKPWMELPAAAAEMDGRPMAEVIVAQEDYLGTFVLERDAASVAVDAWSNIIQDDDGAPMYRLVALAETVQRSRIQAQLEKRVENTDTLLRELQHRVKNNLQMVTALIRLEARGIPDDATTERFDRLAGRIDSLGLLYRALSGGTPGNSVDLGTYLSQIASAVMQAHAVEGIRLDLKVDTWPVSIDVAMPTGLVVNELLTNALKHAFTGRSGGTIQLHSLVDVDGCRVIVADDGNGLADGDEWPRAGKLGSLILKSLKQNAKAEVTVTSERGKGVKVSMFFARVDAAPTS